MATKTKKTPKSGNRTRKSTSSSANELFLVQLKIHRRGDAIPGLHNIPSHVYLNYTMTVSANDSDHAIQEFKSTLIKKFNNMPGHHDRITNLYFLITGLYLPFETLKDNHKKYSDKIFTKINNFKSNKFTVNKLAVGMNNLVLIDDNLGI